MRKNKLIDKNEFDQGVIKRAFILLGLFVFSALIMVSAVYGVVTFIIHKPSYVQAEIELQKNRVQVLQLISENKALIDMCSYAHFLKSRLPEESNDSLNAVNEVVKQLKAKGVLK